jgi:hypothetical protein
MNEISAMVSLVYKDWQNAPLDAPDEFYRAILQLVQNGKIFCALDDTTGEVVYWSANSGG